MLDDPQDKQDEQQRAFTLAYCLHPDRDVALCVVVEAHDWHTRLNACETKRSTTQERRWAARGEDEPAPQPYKPDLPKECLPQLALYHASNRWERDQESGAPQLHPHYCPTSEQVLIRYIKELVWQTMTRRAAYTAVALGCCLYTYRPGEVSRLVCQAPDHCRRVKRRILPLLQDRFPHIIAPATVRMRLQPPTCEERRLIGQALRAFTPWTSHTPQRPPHGSIWETYFHDTASSDRAEQRKRHALIDPACAGLVQLIDDYNRRVGDVRFDDPHNKLAIPLLRASGPPPPGDPFRPEPLSRRDRDRIEFALARNRARRQAFRAGPLVVYVDGHEHARLGPSPGPWPAFAVPADASYVEVVGHDADGPLLLAVFPVPARPAAAGTEQHLVLRVEGGQTIEMVVRPGHAGQDEGPVYRMQIAYEDAPRPLVSKAPAAVRARVDAGDGDRLTRWLSSAWVPPEVGLRWTAGGETPPQTHVFDLKGKEGEITIVCSWQAAYHDMPATLQVAWRASLSKPSDIWLRFTQPDTATLLAEVRLGSRLEDQRYFTQATLGFDPSQERWAMAIVLRDLP